ncbi:hypothetical protein RS030_152299 [Cryptosporidium xiaoi]|uniref:Uncharacterized protein n=1 Tax=Cryptosporidium xiaoi TaxID=659607 RepID=A0AAV9Y0Q4_9CRYT
MHLRGVYFIKFYILFILPQCLLYILIFSKKVSSYCDKSFISSLNETKNDLNGNFSTKYQSKSRKYDNQTYKAPKFNIKAPTFKEKIFTLSNKVENGTRTQQSETLPSRYYLYERGKYVNLESDNLKLAPYKEKVHDIKTKYYWQTEGNYTIEDDYKNLNLEYLYSRGLFTTYPEELYNINKTHDLEILEDFINGTKNNSIGFSSYISSYDKNIYQVRNIPKQFNYKDINYSKNEVIRKVTLSNSDPIDIIQEKKTIFQNMRWSPYLKNKIPIGIPEQIINFDYDNEVDEDEFYGKKGDLFKKFLGIASDFSFLFGSTLNAAVCMYKAVLPLMLIRWKSVNSITISRLDSIIKITMGIPFFKYFEEKENMINVCVNMFHTMDISAYEGLGLGDESFESSVIGISVSDFKVYQYFMNKKKSNSNIGNTKRPNDFANLLEVVYDNICHYFYECMDEDLKENIDDYVFNQSHIFDIDENKKDPKPENSSISLLPDISERRTSIDSLPSDKFIASLQEMSYIIFDLPEMSFPGMNIRDISRLYYYSGRIGLKLPLRLIIKMIYEISNFANYSVLLRQNYCTESLSKITSFKLSEVICSISFMYAPTKIQDSNIFFTIKDIERRVLASPSKRKLRPNPVCSNSELNSIESSEILYVPDFIQFKVTQDKWMLYRSLGIQLYGSISVENSDTVSSVISLIHSAVLGYIRLNWDEFKALYTSVGVLNPELYYSLLLNHSRGPALIELIAFSRIYQIPIRVYYKRINYDPKLKIEFHLERELTELIENLSKVDYNEDSLNKYFEGNTNKSFPCKIIRLLVDSETPKGYYKNVFTDENDMIPEEAKITNNVRDKTNFIWDSLLPLYDEKTNDQIISKGAGIKVNYKIIEDNFLDEANKDVKFENNNGLSGRGSDFHEDDKLRETEIRRYSNHTYGKVFINTQQSPKSRVNSSDKMIENNGGSNNTLDDHIRHLNQYYIVVQPLISFFDVGVYESRMFMYKIFEEHPLFNWDELQETINLEFLQRIIYIGNTTNETIDINRTKTNEYDLQNKHLNSIKKENITEYSWNDEIDENFASASGTQYKTEHIKSRFKNQNLESELSSEKYNFDVDSEVEFIELDAPGGNVEFPPVFLPTKKPWNGKIDLSKYGLVSGEPSFSFIPFSDVLPKPRKMNGTPQKFDLNLSILFNIVRDYWMLPLDTVSTVLFCFANSVSPYLFNPDPNYTPSMIVYDKIVSTVISQLPVMDKKLKVRPIAFVITVCEMALLDPIDLSQFLFIDNKYVESNNRYTSKNLIKMFGRMYLVREICSQFSSCVTSWDHQHEIDNLSAQQSTSMIYNPFTPESSNVIQIQELIPRFPEVVIISKNLFRMVYYIGRKGISIEKEALYQIAKELAISMHSISPFIWKSKIDLENYEDFDFSENNVVEKCSYIPTYQEAYWNNFDRQLILGTCASILTTRNVVSYPSAMVICHYSFLRVPLSRFGISTSIPSDEDLIEDERVSMQSVSFYLSKIVENPMNFIKSVEYNTNPMKAFVDIFYEVEGEDLINWDEKMSTQFRSFFKSEYISEIYVRYDDFIKYFLKQGGKLVEREVIFGRNTDEYNFSINSHSKIGFQKKFPKNGFSDGLNRFNVGYKNKFSGFWRYIPEPYVKNLNKSTSGSSVDDIFESVSLLLYGTNTHKSLIKSTILSALSLIEKVCESESDIIKRFTTKDVYINVEGVDEDIVSYVFEMCDKQRMKKSMPNEHIEQLYNGNSMNHLNIFELIQFIYKVPLMVFEMDNKSKFVRDTEINQRLFDSVNNKSLLYSIKIAKILLDGTGKSFKYQPLIPKVHIEDFFYLKDGVGPIPHVVMARTISLTKRKDKNRTSGKLRRTLFDDAVENYYNRKKPSDFYKMKPEGRFHEELIPIFRKFIPFPPGEIEGNRLLQFVKMTTAIIDLKRRPIKELPDSNMEKSIKSLLLNNELKDQRNNLIDNYGIDFDELVNTNIKFGSNINEEKYREFMDKMNYKKYLFENSDPYPTTREFNPQTYKFILDYYSYVKNSKADPTLLEAIFEAGKQVRPFKQEKDPEKRAVNEIIKFSAINIFSELYYYWNVFMLKLNNFYYNTKYHMGFGYTEEEKEDLKREKNLKKYIKSGPSGITEFDNNQKQTVLSITHRKRKTEI